MTNEQIQRSVRRHLRQSDLTVYRVAKESGITYGYLCAFNRDELDLGLRALLAVCKVLNLRLDVVQS